MEILTILKQEIIELVRLSAAEGVRNVGFSSSWVSIRTGDLISIKSIGKLTKYIGQLFISIVTLMGFWLWVSGKCKSISY